MLVRRGHCPTSKCTGWRYTTITVSESFCKVSLKDEIDNDIILGWCNVARVSTIVDDRGLRWLGQLTRSRMSNERLLKRELFGDW